MPQPIPVDIEIAGPATAGTTFTVTVNLDSTCTQDTQVQLTSEDANLLPEGNDTFPVTLTVPAGQESASYTLTAVNTGYYRLMVSPDSGDITDPDDWSVVVTVPVVAPVG